MSSSIREGLGRMYICICHAVTERELREAIAAGARTEEAVGVHCGAGTSCGTCLERIGDMLGITTECSRGRILAEQTG
jgi:bacterioferritin-associated ferredoxin